MRRRALGTLLDDVTRAGWALVLGMALPLLVCLPSTTTSEAAAITQIDQAVTQLEAALTYAEQSLGPHQPGSGWTRQHMQRVVNVIEGKGGPNVREVADQPAEGPGLARTLSDAQEQAKAQGMQNVIEPLQHALGFVTAAREHALRSIKGTSVVEVHSEARLVIGLLVAAQGRAQADSPVTGALARAARLASESGNR